MSVDEIVADYEDREKEDILAVFAYATQLNSDQEDPNSCSMKFLVDAQLLRRFHDA